MTTHTHISGFPLQSIRASSVMRRRRSRRHGTAYSSVDAEITLVRCIPSINSLDKLVLCLLPATTKAPAPPNAPLNAATCHCFGLTATSRFTFLRIMEAMQLLQRKSTERAARTGVLCGALTLASPWQTQLCILSRSVTYFSQHLEGLTIE